MKMAKNKKIIKVKEPRYGTPMKPADAVMRVYFGAFKKVPVQKKTIQILSEINELTIHQFPQSSVDGILIEGDFFGSTTIHDKYVCISRADTKDTFTVTKERRTKKEKQKMLEQFKKFIHF